MAKRDLKRYSSEEVDRLNEQGDFVSTRENAPTIDLDEKFWDALGNSNAGSDGVEIRLRVRPSTLGYFDTTGEDLSLMVRVLDAYAEAMTKKAAE